MSTYRQKSPLPNVVGTVMTRLFQNLFFLTKNSVWLLDFKKFVEFLGNRRALSSKVFESCTYSEKRFERIINFKSGNLQKMWEIQISV